MVDTLIDESKNILLTGRKCINSYVDLSEASDHFKFMNEEDSETNGETSLTRLKYMFEGWS